MAYRASLGASSSRRKKSVIVKALKVDMVDDERPLGREIMGVGKPVDDKSRLGKPTEVWVGVEGGVVGRGGFK
jgi:hypothetical protein